MAEYGAHHATYGETKPSLFEVLGQENLVAGLRLAFRHIFKVLIFFFVNSKFLSTSVD